MNGYTGRFFNDDVTKLSSSGGAATAFAKAFIERGGVVLGVCYSDDFEFAQYYLVKKVEELKFIIGTKYLLPKTYIKNIGMDLFSWLKQNNLPILIFGLGCLISCIKQHCLTNKISLEKIYFIELICHGATHNKVQKDYVAFLQKKHKSRIIDFNIRYKKRSWKPFYLKAVFENGKVYTKPFYYTRYGCGFSNLSLNSCYSCKFKGENHPGNIIIGDCWSESVSDFPAGLSLILALDKKGDELIKFLDTNDFLLEKRDLSTLLLNNPMFFKSRNETNSKNSFLQNLYGLSLKKAVIKEKGILKYIIQKALRKID